jgi:hypothetical protein
MDYIFILNYYDSRVGKRKWNHGFYLITKIYCDHDKEHGNANSNRDDGKWIR